MRPMGTLGGAESDVIIGWRVIVLVVIVQNGHRGKYNYYQSGQYNTLVISALRRLVMIIYMQTGVVNATMTKLKCTSPRPNVATISTPPLYHHCYAALTVSCCPAVVFSA